jgi:hypothetical protein
MRSKIFLLAFLPYFATLGAQTNPDREDWISLFNGRNLENWVVKIRHHEVGVNFGETFRVEDGVIKARYDKYNTFDNQFGHPF